MGFEAAGMTISWQCELDAWKRSVLAAHWPNIPIYKDVVELADHVANSGNRLSGEILHEGQQDRRLSNNTPDTDSAITQRGFGDVDPVDVLIGGFPCQDLSVAGRRKGFSGERSVLAFEFLRVAESLQPRWIVLENVPGLLSSNGGRDFARLIDEVVGCGYGVAWRILDARYFGVPQRRRRVFIVARRADSQHDPRSASRLALRALFESGSGDTSSGWQAWTETTRSVGDGADDGGSVGTHGRVDEGPTGTLTRMYSEQSGQDFGGGRSDCIYNSTAAFGAWREDREAGALSQRDYKSTNHILIGNGGGQRECAAFRKSRRAKTVSDHETWVDADHANTLNAFDVGDTRTTHAVVAHGVSASDDKIAGTLCTNSQGGQRTTDIAGAYVSQTYPIDDGRPVEKHQNGTGIGEDGAPAYTLDRLQHASVVQTFSVYPEGGNGADIAAAKVERSPSLTKVNSERGIHVTHSLTKAAAKGATEDGTGRGTPIVPDQMTVRRLTPIECERLMGWPDGWTAPEGVKASDSKRYAACGDGIVAPVAFWIADRIRMIEEEEAS